MKPSRSIIPLLAVLSLSASPKLRASGACCHTPPEAAEPLPAASLYQAEAGFTADDGLSFRLARLRGSPVVIAMFFSSCAYACPTTIGDILRIRETLPAGLREEARVVMVSFDVERDTPAALRAFRESRGLPSDWVLLHGAADSVRELAALLGVKYKREADGSFAHSNLITILSREGEIVHQRPGLAGGVGEAAQALAEAIRAPFSVP